MSKYVQLNLFELGGSAASVFKIFPPAADTGDLRDRIELAGGIVLESDEEDPHVIPLVDIKWLSQQPEELQNKSHIPSESFFSTFIYDCYEWERLFDLNPYRAGDSKYFPYDANEILQRKLSWPELRLKPVFEPISAEKLKSQYETPRKRRNLHDNSSDRTAEIEQQQQDTGIIPTAETHQDLEGGTDDPEMDASMNLNPVSVEIRHDEELVLRRIESEEDDGALSDVECIPATPKTPKTSTNNTSKPRKNQSPRNSTKASPKNTPKANQKEKSGSSVGLARQKNGTPASSRKNPMANGNNVVVENETAGFGSRTSQKSERSSVRKQRRKSPEHSPSNLEPGEESQDESEVALSSTELTGAGNSLFQPKPPISALASNGHTGEHLVIVNDMQNSVQKDESDVVSNQQQRSRKSSGKRKKGKKIPQEEVEDEMETSSLVDNTETSASVPENANDHDGNIAEDVNNEEVVSNQQQRSRKSSGKRKKGKKCAQEEVEDEMEASILVNNTETSTSVPGNSNDHDANTAEYVNKEEANVEITNSRKSKKNSQRKRQKKIDEAEEVPQVESNNLSPSTHSTLELKKSSSTPSKTPKKSMKTLANKPKDKAERTVEIVVQNGEENVSSRKAKNSERKRKKNSQEVLDPSDVPEMSQNEPEVSEVPRKTPKKSKKSKKPPSSLDTDAPTQTVEIERAHQSSSISTKRVTTSVESSGSGFYQSKRRRKSINTSESNSSSSSMPPLQLPLAFSSSEDSASETTSKTTKKKRKSSKTEKFFTCSSCSFTTSQQLNLVHHMRFHTGEVKFQCTYCTFSATDKSSLKKHQKLHSQGGKLCCIMCDFSTNDTSQLQAHFKSHDDTKTYECLSCNFKASTAYKLRVHRTKTHPEL